LCHTAPYTIAPLLRREHSSNVFQIKIKCQNEDANQRVFVVVVEFFMKQKKKQE